MPQGAATLIGSAGRTLHLKHSKNDDLPLVQRNGQPREWQQQITVYAPAEGKAPVTQAWGGGTLRVEASDHIFESRLSPDGRYSFTD